MVSASDLLELARHLKQEHLFVSNERKELQILNEKVMGLIENVYHVSYITRQQKIILNHLILSHPEYPPSLCCQKSNTLESATFCDSYKHLNFHDMRYGEFLQKMRFNPKLLATCLINADKNGIDSNLHISVILSSIYGNCILYEDEYLVLKLLKNLIEFQLAFSENPCRMLRHGSCAFSRVYKDFNEGLFSAKIFLTASLHAPILHLLMEDNMFLDIDPGKAVIRFPPHERQKKFGVEGTPEYAKNLRDYREWTIDKLVNLTNRFITSIKQSMYCFPLSLSWLIKQVYEIVMRAGKVDQRQVGAICADLLFSFFICPAIVNPEPYSITTDTPISYVARFNLMQVAQILQVLAMCKYEDIDPKLTDLYGKFEKDCMSSLLDLILNSNDEIGRNLNSLPGLTRSAVLITESNLMELIQYLREVLAKSNDSNLDVKFLEMCLDSLPVTVENTTAKKDGGASTASQSLKRNSMNTKVRSKARPGFPPNQREQASSFSDQNVAAVENPEPVLVVTINMDHGECPGMLSTEKVLMDYKKHSHKININPFLRDDHDERSPHGKRTRFSLSHDQDSIGNVSDNFEAISELNSNRSVASSIDLENENGEADNFSDMVSANVSGRGTPNVSGRETPSSQIEGDQSRSLGLPITAQKQNREDINEKFGKFEIKQLVTTDETRSMVSDTWSTDVLASDSETVEQTETPMNVSQVIMDPPMHQPPGANYLDISETTSEAWSTDVITSDNERLQDIDTDETGSIATARSDETARSEIDGDVFAVPSAAHPGIPSPAENLDGVPPLLPPGKPEEYRNHEYGDRNKNRATDMWNKHGNSSQQNDHSSAHRFQPIVTADLTRPTNSIASRHDNNNIKMQDSNQMPNLLDGSGLQFSSEPSQQAFNSSGFPDFPRPNNNNNNKIADGDLLNIGQPITRCQHSRNEENQSVEALFDPLHTNTIRESHELRQNFAEIRLSAASTVSNGSSSNSSKDTSSSNEIENFNKNQDNLDGAVASCGSSMGAIPKYSSEPTLEASYKDSMDHDKGSRDKDKKSFFKSFKLTFKNRNKKFRGADKDDGSDSNLNAVSQPTDSDGNYYSDRPEPSQETGEDILAKYRNKPKTDCNAPPINEPQCNPMDCVDGTIPLLEYDNRNPEASFVFTDAKRKLRLVLGQANIPMIPLLSRSLGKIMQLSANKDMMVNCDNEIVAFLEILLAEAINLEQHSLIAQLHEALRCVKLFDRSGSKKLFKSLRDDYKKRYPYIAYLTKSRQGLLTTIDHLERTLNRIERDKVVCNKFMISMCVRIFLAEREDLIKKFVDTFQKLSVPDEKTECVENFLDDLNKEVESSAFWKGASYSQIEMAIQVIERDIMSQIYLHALYPNGDGDIKRDQVLHKHMKQLSEVITPNHKDLCIPSKYHYECPWPSAQVEIVSINAYKTPKDKLQSVVRCCTTIMNLLSMVSEKSVPAADDFMPVLVYVLIMANPSSLLSTVQYVNSFYEKRLEGEDSYWWTQFEAAIEFIKTMSY